MENFQKLWEILNFLKNIKLKHCLSLHKLLTYFEIAPTEIMIKLFLVFKIFENC